MASRGGSATRSPPTRPGKRQETASTVVAAGSESGAAGTLPLPPFSKLFTAEGVPWEGQIYWGNSCSRNILFSMPYREQQTKSCHFCQNQHIFVPCGTDLRAGTAAPISAEGGRPACAKSYCDRCGVFRGTVMLWHRVNTCLLVVNTRLLLVLLTNFPMQVHRGPLPGLEYATASLTLLPMQVHRGPLPRPRVCRSLPQVPRVPHDLQLQDMPEEASVLPARGRGLCIIAHNPSIN